LLFDTINADESNKENDIVALSSPSGLSTPPPFSAPQPLMSPLQIKRKASVISITSDDEEMKDRNKRQKKDRNKCQHINRVTISTA